MRHIIFQRMLNEFMGRMFSSPNWRRSAAFVLSLPYSLFIMSVA